MAGNTTGGPATGNPTPTQVADGICEQLERRIAAGEQARAAHYLDRHPELAAFDDLTYQVIEAEWLARKRTGESPPLTEYVDQFPHYRPQLERLFAGPRPTAPPPTAPPPESPAEYELLDEIGSGGMGAIYRARDRKLRREVAVKVLLPRLAPRSDITRRFYDEARITGQLQHPGVPPVHDLGELPDGRPFLAMKLIKGETLAALFKARPDPAADRGRLVAVFEGICQAVGYAHSRGVIHRDLKPANVMVGNFGEVQVMDWGLAKVLPDAGGGEQPTEGEPPPASAAPSPLSALHLPHSGGTQAGTLLGTPQYTAPEQARGEVDTVDRRADVFALGAILCELLTGKPPFDAPDSKAATRLAAAADLTGVLPALGRCGADGALVDVCIRCLSASPTGRPKDARVVAKAVEAYRADVQARAELARRRRVWRWAGVAVGVALAVGTGASVAFAFHANAKADEARAEKGNAVAAAGREKVEKENAVAANTEAQRALAKALLASFADDKADGEAVPFGEYERDALWELSRKRDQPAGLMFLQEAIRTRSAAARFRHRAAPLYHAVVGLDARRRKEADDLLSGRLLDTTCSAELKGDVAAAVVDTGEFGRPDVVADALVAALEPSSGPGSRQPIVRLPAVCERLPAEKAAETLLAARRDLARGGRPVTATELAGLLAAVCERLPAEKAAETLLAALEGELNALERVALAKGLARADGRLSPGRPTEVCLKSSVGMLAELDKVAGDNERLALAEGIAAVCERLPAEKAAETLLAAWNPVKIPVGRRVLALGLAAVYPRLPSGHTGGVRAKGTEALLSALRDEMTPDGRRELAEGLVAVCGQTPADEAADTLLAAIGRAKCAAERRALSGGLATACGQLAGEGKVGSRAAKALLAALGKEPVPSERWELAEGLVAVCGQTHADEAADTLLAAMDNANSSAAQRALATGLAAACKSLPKEKMLSVVRSGADKLLATAEKVDWSELKTLAAGLSAVCGQLPTNHEVHRQAAGRLLTALGKAKHVAERRALAEWLAAVCGQLSGDQRDGVCERAADDLLAELRKTRHSGEQRDLAQGLAAVAACTASERVAEVCDQAAGVLGAVLEGNSQMAGHLNLAEGLVAVCERLERRRGENLCQQASNVVLTRLGKSTNATERQELLLGLAVLGELLPDEAANSRHQAARALLDELGAATTSDSRRTIVAGIGTLASGLRRVAYARRHYRAEVTALAGGVALQPSLLSHPRPLPTQQLVELLKHPFCVGEARRAVLDALELACDRKFADLWAFVEFAEGLPDDKKPDLLRPPERSAK